MADLAIAVGDSAKMAEYTPIMRGGVPLDHNKNDVRGKVGSGSKSEISSVSEGSSGGNGVMDKEKEPKKKLHWVMLMFMAYVAAYGGGAFVVEDQIASAFPLLALIALLLFPWLSGFPVAMMTAELSSAMPENGGFVIWIDRAFGKFWAFQIAWLQTIARIIDLALYPVIFTQYFRQVVSLPGWASPLLNLVVVVASVILNILGIEAMGVMSIVLSVLSLSPFLVYFAIGAKDIDPSTWIVLPPEIGMVKWGVYISIASWNVSGFDSLSQVAGELSEPRKFSWAMIGAMIMITISSFLPISVLLSAERDYGSYYGGFWSVAGDNMAGLWLKVWFTSSACVSMFATFNNYLFTSGITVATWAQPDGGLDIPLLTALSRFRTPYVSILLQAVIVYACSFLDFADLIQVDTSLYSLALILEFCALIYLRVVEPNMPRPYKIGLSTIPLALAISPAFIIAALNIIFAMSENYLSFALVIISVVLGPVAWFLRRAVTDCHRKRAERSRADYPGDMYIPYVSQQPLAAAASPGFETIDLDSDVAVPDSPTSPARRRTFSGDLDDYSSG
eukprot:TRINITY_DN12960_c0_g1_i1.p1 TRINITY_DN12960_c0_g1~~TRINITY_DN12960_c0_g1_i1.p1  ORF type:complete len:562 (-),score=79.66 TRINITY_DN12960_c0_g1_i1:132-1817(-)